MSTPLLPQAFWFRVSIPCRRVDGLPRTGPRGRLLDLPGLGGRRDVEGHRAVRAQRELLVVVAEIEVVAVAEALGQLDAALRTLELAPLTSKSRAAWVVRLRYAYADTLEAAGRESDALAWFHRTHAVDSDELTDSAERAEILERRQS